jgi:TolB protein
MATIGQAERPPEPVDFAVGPLRLLGPDAESPRTLLDGIVLAFWWSPDGSTIAALRVQPVVPATPGRTRELRLLFVDAETGEIGAQAVVTLGRLFIDQLLPYFDQYALSHRLWAPDSSRFLLPIVDGEGVTHLGVFDRTGGDPVLLDGQAGFWSP